MIAERRRDLRGGLLIVLDDQHSGHVISFTRNRASMLRRIGGWRPSGLAWRREAVELVADGNLAVRQPRRVLLQQLALRPHQLSGVVVLHLLLQRAGRRCRKRHTGVDRMWRSPVRHTAAVLGNPRGARKRREYQRQGRKR